MKTQSTLAREIEISHAPDPSRNDGGGSMIITAYTPEAKADALKHFRMFEGDPTKAAKAITSETPLIITKTPKNERDGTGWFECSGALDVEFSTPYFDELRKRTGYTGRGILPDLSPEFLTPFYTWRGLHHTHYLQSIHTDGGHLCYSAIVSCGDWNGRKAGDRSFAYAEDCIKGSVGTRYQEPEMIQAGNNHFYKNPNYLKRHPVKPSLSASWLFSALCEWWLENEANDAQRALVAADAALMKANHNGVGNLRDLKSYGTRELRTDWTSPAIGWEEFQRIK